MRHRKDSKADRFVADPGNGVKCPQDLILIAVCLWAAATGRMTVTPGLESMGLWGITLFGWMAFVTMSLTRDYSGGRYIRSTGEIFICSLVTVALAHGDTAMFCTAAFLCVIPVYLIFSMAVLHRHISKGTLGLLPGVAFRGKSL